MNAKERTQQSIFEAASQAEKHRKLRAEAGVGLTAEPSPDETFLRCKRLHEELNASLDATFRRGGFSPRDYSNYISESKNFSEREWQEVQHQRRENEGVLQGLTKAEAPDVSSGEAVPSKHKEGKKASSKKPKVVPRRRWLWMP